MVEFNVVPKRTALVNVDLQNLFVDGTEGALEIVEQVNRLATVCRDAGILVIHTRHAIRADHANIGVLGEIVPAVREGLIDEGSPGPDFHPDLRIEPTDVRLTKPRFGAFHGTDLEMILRSRDIDSVIITGINTDVCCDTTAREANARDFKVLFLSDATATSAENAKDVQRTTLALISALFGQVLTTDEIIAKIKSA